MSNFWQRLITGVLFITVLLGAMLWSKYSIALLLFPTALIGLNEFYTITRSNKTQIPKTLAMVIGGLTYLLITAVRVFDLPGALLSLCIVLVSILLVTELFRAQKRPITNIAYGIFGILYIVVPFALLNYIPLDSHGVPKSGLLLVAFFASLWANDTGAYCSGRLFGKHKLFVRISPNKTWEGFYGGLFFCVLTGYIFSRFDSFLTPVQWIGFSLIIGVFGTLGDLVESMLKRNYNIKDSGKLLPGHGGVLDRFDGIFLACPLVIAYLELVAMVN
ncbi:MAG: phosphatidate cytidylyltransferase [Bacteroidota bacterium]